MCWKGGWSGGCRKSNLLIDTSCTMQAPGSVAVQAADSFLAPEGCLPAWSKIYLRSLIALKFGGTCRGPAQGYSPTLESFKQGDPKIQPSSPHPCPFFLHTLVLCPKRQREPASLLWFFTFYVLENQTFDLNVQGYDSACPGGKC